MSALFRQIDGIAPTFSKKPTIRQEDDGKRLLFECRIQADPRPTVTWSHTGVEVKQGPRHKVKFNSIKPLAGKVFLNLNFILKKCYCVSCE